ncbi:unnamed protein product [Phytophthora lilii]|uniref:Unnamed protein product n=1 Tax=Phytophthora lilii TaxID=2077276 RepID=A0A9W6TX19_9STRA|nr:unnamed protein product [Phytophthora lilii]
MIDDTESVSRLKVDIKIMKADTIKCNAAGLQLFLARADEGRGPWLNEEDVKSDAIDTTGLKLLGVARARLWSVGLSDEDVGGVDAEAEAEAEGRGPVNVLVVVPEQKQKEQSQDEANASLADEELGHLLLQRLKKDNLFFEVTPTDNDEEAFWSDDVQRHVNNIRDEAAFDTFITPCLNATLGSCDLVFINSQRYRCLPLSPFVATALKPYGFATHRGMFRAKPAPNDEVLRPDGFRFGVAEEELFDCLVLFERKLTITAAAFGQVARYLQNFRPNESATAILFHLHSFWLVTSYESVVVKVQVAQWTNKGSKSLFQNFITDNISPWVAHLTLLSAEAWVSMWWRVMHFSVVALMDACLRSLEEMVSWSR